MKKDNVKEIKRNINIILRAVEDFGMQVDYEDSFIDILQQAEDTIMENVEYDRIDTCEFNSSSNGQYVAWSDGKGYVYEVSGDITGHSEKSLDWYRYDYKKNIYTEIPWYEAVKDEDYFATCKVLDSDAKVVLLVAK